jgi:hypothetical protein
VPGLLAFIWLLAAGFAVLVNKVRELKNTAGGNVLLGLAGCFAAFTAHGCLDCFIGVHPIALLFWLMLALIVNSGDKMLT